MRNVETVRHEALHDRAEVKGLRSRAVAAAWLKLRAAEPGGAGEAGAALTTTGRAGTARRCGSGKRDEKVYERNQRLKPRKRSTGSNLADMGRDAVRDRRREAGSTPDPVGFAGREATVKACGVTVAMLPGQSWVPSLSTGHEVNVGTSRIRPPCRASSPAAGRLAVG
jgi:hypothetical protein